MFNQPHKKVFQNRVIGTWGTFQSAGGKVEYISTKAKLGGAETSNERRLTALLRPVREMLPVASLDFGQLLQRDLDDHRVATSLIPYLFKHESATPAFFPPIVAVLLPFEVDQPAIFEAEGNASQVDWLGTDAQERLSGDAYRSLKHCRPDGSLHETQLGSLEWNEERGKLVVLDGQHRAMALLAIYRTMTKTWKTSGAERYSHFYESNVDALIKKGTLNLENIEVPVSVCWFPDLAGREMEPHKAARKLFVDLNREARTPSEARLTLLSDSELVSIFARSLLNTFRSKQHLSLYSIDYDNPEQDSGKVARWSAITNLECLKAASRYLVFGPARILDELSFRIPSGKPPQKSMDEFMRTQLDVMNLYPESIDDGGRIIPRSDLGNSTFPRSLSPNKLEVSFSKTWGTAIARLLGGLAPYQAHNEAIMDLETGWVAPDGASSLAKEALFDGVGMYWTLKSSADYYSEKLSEAKLAKTQVPHKGDVVKAWVLVQPGGAKHNEFKEIRATKYLGSANKTNLIDSENIFSVFSTSACQLGMFLAFGSLARKCNVKLDEVADFSQLLTDAWNTALNSSFKKRSRKLIFSKDAKNAINMMGKLDASLCVYFRYLWLELLCLDEVSSILQSETSPKSLPIEVKTQTDAARRFYVSYLISEQCKVQKQVNPTHTEKAIKDKSMAVVQQKISNSLAWWFDKSASETSQWWASLATGNVVEAAEAPEGAEYADQDSAEDSTDFLENADDPAPEQIGNEDNNEDRELEDIE